MKCGTLASELGDHVDRTHVQPRVYVDANVPAAAGGVHAPDAGVDCGSCWSTTTSDARDGEHYRLAKQLRRTLISLDRDYLDDRRFPLAESGGVIVLMAPEERDT